MAALLVKLSKEVGITYRIQTFAIGMEGSPDLEAARKVRQSFEVSLRLQGLTTSFPATFLKKKNLIIKL